jgi:hypothetical protein
VTGELDSSLHFVSAVVEMVASILENDNISDVKSRRSLNAQRL